MYIFFTRRHLVLCPFPAVRGTTACQSQKASYRSVFSMRQLPVSSLSLGKIAGPAQREGEYMCPPSRQAGAPQPIKIVHHREAVPLVPIKGKAGAWCFPCRSQRHLLSPSKFQSVIQVG